MGPTASGKSALAMALANYFDLELISVDSAMVYRGMDIGTAKPRLAERRHVPHHLIDIRDPSEPYSTAQFQQDALEAMAQVIACGRLPLLVGGTMLYFRSLEHGLADLPAADPWVRSHILERAERLGWSRLHAELAKIDPQAAASIHRNDPQRIQRALEVFEITGRPLTELYRAGGNQHFPYQLLKLGLGVADRSWLHERIGQRFHGMLQEGLVEEVRSLWARGDLHSGLPSMRAVGYRQIWEYLEGRSTYNEAVAKGISATRQLAKRQFTWLRSERNVVWLDVQNADLARRAERTINAFFGLG